MSSKKEVIILCFTWNASGLRICEKNSIQDVENERKGLKGFLFNQKDCERPEFFEYIRELIKQNKANLIAITTQDEDIKGSYFHSKFLPNTLSELNYILLKSKELNNVGDLPSGVNNHPDYKTSGSVLRSSIYIRNDDYKTVRQDEIVLDTKFKNKGQISLTYDYDGRKIGAIGSYVNLYGRKMLFIAVDLPENKIYETYPKYSKRELINASNTMALINIIHRLYEIYSVNDKLINQYKADYIILYGSMNFNIYSDDIIDDLNSFYKKKSSLIQKDDLSTLIKNQNEPYYLFKEGVKGKGPEFLPTWKMSNRRISGCSFEDNKDSKYNFCYTDSNKEIGWHDRILYFSKYNNLDCRFYQPFEFSTKSDHVGVWSGFIITD